MESNLKVKNTKKYKDFKKILKSYYKKIGIDVNEFTLNDLNDLPDFSELKDIKKASLRIKEAISNKEVIGIYGDYDADGTTSLALFYHFLKKLKVKPNIYQPNRFIEGYGLHRDLIKKAKGDGVSLLITFDCGISNHESAKYAQEIGVELIITDHHNDGGLELPYAHSVVNPKRKDQEDGPMKSLAGVGVAFALALETKKAIGLKESIYDLLQFVAIGTIGDVVPLNSMNAKMVRHGLRQFRGSKYPAISLAATCADFPGVNSSYIGFKLAPMINSKGRLGSPDDSLKFLVSDTDKEALEYYEKIKISNLERKSIQKEGKEAVKNNLKKENGLREVIVVFEENLSQGVVGLIASSISRQYKRPSIVLTNDNRDRGLIKGSARSWGDFDLYGFISSLDFKFNSFGGHKKAAGMSMKREQLGEFKKAVRDKAINLEIKNTTPKSIKIKPSDIGWHIPVAISEFEPFGEGNPRIDLEVIGVVSEVKIMKEEHLSFKIEGCEHRFVAFYFNEMTTIDVTQIIGKKVKTRFSVDFNEFNHSINLGIYCSFLELFKDEKNK